MTNKSKWLDDPMVPVIGERVEALRIKLGFSEAELARRVDGPKGKRQTINWIVIGKTRNCRRSRLEGIARALKMPGYPQWFSDPTTALEYADAKQGPLVQVIRAAFGTVCKRALERDFPRLAGDDEEWDQMVRSMLDSLIRPRSWAHRMLWDWHAGRLTTKQHEEDITVGLAEAFQVILGPWIKGRAELDLEGLKRIIGIEGTAAAILDRYRNLRERRIHPL